MIRGYNKKILPVILLALAALPVHGIDRGPTPAEQIRKIAARWAGEYDNHLQVRSNLDRSGAARPELTRERRELQVTRLDAPRLGETVLYFQEFLATKPGLAHRQRVVSLVWDDIAQQVRAEQLFFKGARYDREPLSAASVAELSPDAFFRKPFCDLFFTWEPAQERHRGSMGRGSCVSEHPQDGMVYAEYEMLLYGDELWYRDRSIKLSTNSIRGEIDGFSWLLFTPSKLPHIASQQGVWRGIFRRYDAEGQLTEEFPSEIIMRVIPESGKLRYHQTNRYRPPGEPERVIEGHGEVRDGRIFFSNSRLSAWKMDLAADSSGRSAVILMDYTDGSGLYVHQIVSLSTDGRYRARATQYLKDGRIVRRTLIDEEKVTDDWAAYEAAQ